MTQGQTQPAPTRVQLHIMDETSPNAWANRIQMGSVQVVPRVGEIVKVNVPPLEYDTQVFKVEHFFDVSRNVQIVMAYVRRV
jgi:hypothetical protein